MMRVLLFELGDGTYALKLGAVERILAPGEPVPAGFRTIDLAALLGVESVCSPHLALLAGHHAALVIGRPTGAARIDPAWILPLPGYMFRVERPPFRGLIDIPPGGRTGMPAGAVARSGLLLDEDTVMGMQA